MPKPYIYRRAEELGIPVKDAKKPLMVVVTQDDVVNAQKANSKHCALARATMRIPGVNAAYFFRCKAFLEFDNRIERFDLPLSVQKEIVSFDRAQIFAPGMYRIRPSSPANNVEGLKQRVKSDRKRRATAKIVQTLQEAKAAERRIAAAKTSRTKANRGPKQLAELADDVAKVELGKRVLSGIRKEGAPEPLWTRRPTRYTHRTQYVRDLKEPK